MASEDYTIDQVRTLGGPDHISGQTSWLGNVAMTSHVVIEDSIIDQVLTLGGPDRRPAQTENIDFFID